MDSVKLQVIFNGEPVFEPGSEVAGFVFLHLDKPVKARAVKIAVDGRASTHWTEEEHDSS